MKKILSILGIIGVLCVGGLKAESRYSTDVLTGAMVTSPINAAYIHSGNDYFIGVSTPGLSGATTTQFLIDALAITSYTLHLDFVVDVATQSCLVQVYEDATFVSSGVATVPIQLNREKNGVNALPSGYKIYTQPAPYNAVGTLLYSYIATLGSNKNDFNNSGLEISVARGHTINIKITPLGVTTGISVRTVMTALKI